ncbi:hypothetical protein [Burkholderia cenocepacia]|uniref:hypothetical protein n=1 Tax=Burkholderia cenocepacia TaxID=95486 RepID=UPI0038479201
MNNQREEIDLHNMLKQHVEAGETIILTGAGSSAAVEATIKDLAKAARRSASNTRWALASSGSIQVRRPAVNRTRERTVRLP